MDAIFSFLKLRFLYEYFSFFFLLAAGSASKSFISRPGSFSRLMFLTEFDSQMSRITFLLRNPYFIGLNPQKIRLRRASPVSDQTCSKSIETN